MRYHPFEKLQRKSCYCQPDLEYIHDYESDYRVFEKLCQVDNYTAKSMVAAGMAGYFEGLFGEIESNPIIPDEWLDVPNKGYVALWMEDSEKDSSMYVFGLYRHSGKVSLYRADGGKLLRAIYDKNYLNAHNSSCRLFNGLRKMLEP